MFEYQNIFTRVQVRSEPDMGVPMRTGAWGREPHAGFSYWLGKIGNAQVGPIYLGLTGIVSLMCGVIAF